MKKIALACIAVLALNACKEEQPKKQNITVTYPETKQVDTVDTYFGENIKDPYRWLEDDMSEETGAWVKNQNEVTFGYLDNIPYRQELKDRLEKMWNYEKVGSPFTEGDYTYFYKNDGLQNQYVLYRKKGDTGAEEVFLDTKYI
jgi:prolyl oligopeptidase